MLDYTFIGIPASMVLVRFRVQGGCPCPWWMPKSMVDVRVYGGCPCPCFISKTLLHVHVHVVCLCPCCMFMAMYILQCHVNFHYACPHPCPCRLLCTRVLVCLSARGSCARVLVCSCARVLMNKCQNAGLSGIRSVRYRNEKTSDARTGPEQDQAYAIRHCFGPVPD